VERNAYFVFPRLALENISMDIIMPNFCLKDCIFFYKRIDVSLK